MHTNQIFIHTYQEETTLLEDIFIIAPEIEHPTKFLAMMEIFT
jgi:hypothetical protein